jgi:hypothetical protein
VSPSQTAPLKDSHGEVLLAVAGMHVLASFDTMRTVCGVPVNGWSYAEIDPSADTLCSACRTWSGEPKVRTDDGG